jgi:hypothetical protein
MSWFAPGFGWRRGWRRCWWFGGPGRGWGWRWWWRFNYPEVISPEIEKRILQDEAEFLKAVLSGIEKRLAQLEQTS